MVKVTASILVDRPTKQVFASIRDPEIHLKWESSTIGVEKTDENPIGVGSTHRGTVRFLGSHINWISRIAEHEWNRKVVFKIETGNMQFDENWIVEPINENTKVSFVFEGNLQGFLRLLGPIAVRAWQKQAETDLARMKEVLETKV